MPASTTRTTAPTACPAYLAALQIRELSDRQNAAECKASHAGWAKDEPAATRHHDEARRIYWAMFGVQHAAAFLRAESALGAILQLGLMADEGEHLYSLASEKDADERDAKRTRAAIQQMAYSVCAFIERTCGVLREEVGGEYFLPRALDTLGAEIEEAA